jgi:hypothetical protein
MTQISVIYEYYSTEGKEKGGFGLSLQSANRLRDNTLQIHLDSHSGCQGTAILITVGGPLSG